MIRFIDLLILFDLSGGNTVLFKKGTEIGPLHAHPLSCTGEISIKGPSDMAEELAFKKSKRYPSGLSRGEMRNGWGPSKKECRCG